MDAENAFVQSKDKVILSDFLFYVYNGFLNQPKNVIIETCATFYSEDAIWNEKTKFFDAIGKKANPRRSHDRKNKNVEDIINEIETRDAANTFLPTFAATRLHNIPLTPDGAVTNAQIMNCLAHFRRDISNSVRCGRGPNLPSTPGRRIPPTPGFAVNSPTPIFTLSHEASQSTAAPSLSTAAPSHSTAASSQQTASSQTTMALNQSTAASVHSAAASAQSTTALVQSTAASVLSTTALAQSTAASAQFTAASAQFSAPPVQFTTAPVQFTAASVESTAVAPAQSTAASVPSEGETVVNPAETVGTTGLPTMLCSSTAPASYSSAAAPTNAASREATPAVTTRNKTRPNLEGPRKQRRASTSLPKSRKPLLVGKKVSDGTLSWTGADLTTNYYVGRVSNAVDKKVIVDDIESLGVRVVEFDELKLNHSRFKSFRLCIRKADIPKLLIEEFWPEDVVIDRFFWPKNAQRGAKTS